MYYKYAIVIEMKHERFMITRLYTQTQTFQQLDFGMPQDIRNIVHKSVPCK